MSRRKSKRERLAKARKILAGTEKQEISVKIPGQKIEKKRKELRHPKDHMFGRGISIIVVFVLLLIYSLVI